MLLSLMRKHAQSWLIKVLIAIIAVVFVLYFGTMRDDPQNAKKATVNGDLITIKEYEKAYYALLESFRRQYRDMWNDDMIKVFDIKTMALTNLVSQRLISQEAVRLGLEVTEEEVQQYVMDYEAFKVNGSFDLNRYQAVLNQSRLKPEDFELSLGKELLNNKLRQFLSAFSFVTDPEVLDQYTYDNEEVKVSHVQFKPENFKDSVKLDEAAMQDFFDEHREQYRIPEKVKIAYIEIDSKIFEENTELSENEIKDYYEYNIDAYSEPKKVKARHILFKLDEKATEDQEKAVQEKAQPVVKEAREGKPFAELAKKYSEGPTKDAGGDLGYFPAGQMVKPFEDAAFSMKAGEISDLVRTRFGYHIIKVEDVTEARTKTLEEVKDQIEKTLIKNSSVDLAYEKGQTLIDQMPYDIELAQYAAEHHLNAKTTDYLTEGESIPGMGADPKLLKNLFALEKFDTSELVELKDKFYIFQVADRKASYLPEMDAVADKVKADFIDQQAAQEAKSVAEGFLAEIQKGKDWKGLAQEKKIEIEETDFFNRRKSIPKIGNAPELKETLFKLSKDKPYPDTVFETNRGSFVFRWESHKGINEETYEKEKEKQRKSLMQQKQSRLFENWLQFLTERADIEIIVEQ